MSGVGGRRKRSEANDQRLVVSGQVLRVKVQRSEAEWRSEAFYRLVTTLCLRLSAHQLLSAAIMLANDGLEDDHMMTNCLMDAYKIFQ